MIDVWPKLKSALGEYKVKKDEAISGKIASKTGGQVAFYYEAEKQDDLIKAVRIACEIRLPYMLLGTGACTIFADIGYNGLVIKNNCRKFEILSMRGRISIADTKGQDAYLYAESGALLNQIVRYSLDEGYSGMEDLLGSHGSVGGYLHRLLTSEDLVKSSITLYQLRLITRDGLLTYIDPKKNAVNGQGKVISDTDSILSATFLLTAGEGKKLWEKATKSASERGREYSLGAPIGQLFRDISISQAMSAPTPGYMTSATDLIQKAGASNIIVGGVRTDDNGNYLYNTGSVATGDIMELIKEIKSRVFKKFGVKLEMSLKII